MTGLDAKKDPCDYLQGARKALLWKLDGLGEYDMETAARSAAGT
jgi:hypothetical protein